MVRSRDILATLAYYDVLDLPLTSFEIWKHLIVADPDESGKGKGVPFGDVVATLDSPDLSGRICSADGFYFLPGRESLVGCRLEADKIASAKLRRVRRLVRFLRAVPFVRMIGITGSLSMQRSDPGSDWDFFVVLRAGRIFTGRTVLTGILHLLGKRRHGNRSRDRACLNYFITDDRLEIPTEDLFSANEYTRIIPMFGADTFRRFEFRNRWIAGIKPNFHPTELYPTWSVPDTERLRFIRDTLERFLDSDRLERRLSVWQPFERQPEAGHPLR